MPMLTSSRISGVVLFGLAACLPGSRIGAFEGGEGARVEKAPLQTFATPRAALQAGLQGVFFRHPPPRVEALEKSAAGGGGAGATENPQKKYQWRRRSPRPHHTR